MFTGIIQAIGEIGRIEPQGGDVSIEVLGHDLDLSNARIGDSIAVNGVCLTAVVLGPSSFTADASIETLNHTTLNQLSVGSKVNLEKAVLPSEPMGGHIVSGHVDGVAHISSMQVDARSTRYGIVVPAELAKYIARKGSVTVDGVSLTVNEVQGAEFSVNIIPHTQENTLFHQYAEGTALNIEVDVVARYVERLLSHEQDEGGLSYDTLLDNGFVS